MVTYLKCVVANRFTLAGYVFTLTSLVSTIRLIQIADGFTDPLLLSNIFLFIIGVALIVATGGAHHTVDGYHRAKSSLGRGTDPDLIRSLALDDTYCFWAGVQLALKEHRRRAPPA